MLQKEKHEQEGAKFSVVAIIPMREEFLEATENQSYKVVE